MRSCIKKASNSVSEIKYKGKPPNIFHDATLREKIIILRAQQCFTVAVWREDVD